MAKYTLFNEFRHRNKGEFATLEDAIKAYNTHSVDARDAYRIYKYGDVVYPKKKK